MIFNLFRKKDDVMVDYSVSGATKPSNERMDGVPTSTGRMIVEDVFLIKGRGTIVTGKSQGCFSLNQDVVLVRASDGATINTRIKGIEAFHKQLDMTHDGDNCGFLLEDIERDAVARGDEIKTV